ncbi:MAG: alpha/beta fold hydrolase [bacterium]
MAVERVIGGEERGPLPLVLVLHGVGADETQLAPYVSADRPTRFVFLRGTLASGRGYQWFAARFKGDAPTFAAQLYRATAEVLQALDAIASQREIARTVVLGYSQGAHVAWWLATTGRVDRVIAVSGALPAGMRPPAARRPPQIEALHGTRDLVVPFAAGQATARAFEAAGYPVRFRPLRLGGHSLSSIGQEVAPAITGRLSL